jgi:hypothetical protein
MYSWWGEKLAETQPQRPQRPPTIPQGPPPAADALGDLVEQARASMQMATPAGSFEERYGRSPGTSDIGTTARRPGPAAAEAAPPGDLLSLSPQERAMVVRLGTQAGRFEGTETGKAAHDRAAEVQQLVRDKTWTTVEDTTPRKVPDTRIAGATYQR